MDYIVRQSSSRRVRTITALIVLSLVTLLVLLSSRSEATPVGFAHHTRREMVLVLRQATVTPGPTTANSGSSAPTSSSPTPVSASVSSTPNISSRSSVVSSSSSTSITSSFTPSSTSISSSSIPPTTSSQSTSPTTSLSSSSIVSTPSSTLPLTSSRTTSTLASVTTAVVADNIVPLGTSTAGPISSSPPVSNAISNSSRNGFWNNKGAVGATFTFVSLIVIAALIGLFVTFMKKRNARKEAALHDELFPNYNEPSDYRSNSPGPSINDAPMDPFARRDIVYDNTPAMSQAHSSSDTHHNYTLPTVQVTPPVQHPDYYNPHRYMPPSQVKTTAQPISSVRAKHDSAQSGYQPSVDSFYGAGQPSGYR